MVRLTYSLFRDTYNLNLLLKWTNFFGVIIWHITLRIHLIKIQINNIIFHMTCDLNIEFSKRNWISNFKKHVFSFQYSERWTCMSDLELDSPILGPLFDCCNKTSDRCFIYTFFARGVLIFENPDTVQNFCPT